MHGFFTSQRIIAKARKEKSFGDMGTAAKINDKSLKLLIFIVPNYIYILWGQIGDKLGTLKDYKNLSPL